MFSLTTSITSGSRHSIAWRILQTDERIVGSAFGVVWLVKLPNVQIPALEIIASRLTIVQKTL